MIRRSFQAIGTHWQVLIDTPSVSESLWSSVLQLTASFEQKFSRFLPDSEVVRWRDAVKGEYPLSSELERLLLVAQRWRELTGGLFEPAVGGLLEQSGYDAHYRFTPTAEVQRWTLPVWSVRDGSLFISGPVVFDLGGFAKGTLIDILCEHFLHFGVRHFLVDGGGDMRGTSKQDGKPWNTAVEWPGKPGEALCTLPLRDMALAVSDIYQRRWGAWHHLIDPHQRVPANRVLGCSVLAQTAEVADALTTCLALVPSENRQKFAHEHGVEFVVLTEDTQLERSSGWPGTFF